MVGGYNGGGTGFVQCPFAEELHEGPIKEPRGLLGAIYEGSSGCGIAPCLSRR